MLDETVEGALLDILDCFGSLTRVDAALRFDQVIVLVLGWRRRVPAIANGRALRSAGGRSVDVKVFLVRRMIRRLGVDRLQQTQTGQSIQHLRRQFDAIVRLRGGR